MGSAKVYDCVVIGAGPGGYVAAIRARQLGLETALVEREAPGGVCLNWGCIPTKALLKSAEIFETLQHASDYGLRAEGVGFEFSAVIKRSRDVVRRMTRGVEHLLKKNGVDLIMGTASLQSTAEVSVLDAKGNQSIIKFRHAILAAGARPRMIPSLPVDGARIITSREALALERCPERILVLGAGAIGIEFAYFYSAFGAEVTVVEILDQILPAEDREVAAALTKRLAKLGMKIVTNAKVQSLYRDGDTVQATIRRGEEMLQWSGDLCLVAVGVEGNTAELGLEKAGIVTEKSFVRVDSSYRTSAPNVSAIGDIIGPPLLAHVASHEGILAAEHIAGLKPHPLNYNAIPGCTYCRPQVASIGLTESAARAKEINVAIGKFPFSASGKAVAIGETDGFVKVVIDKDSEEVLGIHILHPEATELIGEASVIFSHEGIAASVWNTVHAHPTLSEAIMEAMGAALGRAVHL